MDIKEQWQQTPLWQRILLIVAFSFGLAYLIFILMISPKKEEYDNLNTEVENLKSELEKLKISADSKTLEKLERKINEIQNQNKQKLSKLESLSSTIPQKPELEEILNIVSASAKTSGLVLNNFKVDKEEDIYLYYDKNDNSLKTIQKTDDNKDNKKKDQNQIPENAIHLKKINIQSSFYGNIRGIFPFLDKIATSKRLISVESLNVKKESGNLNYTLSLSVYYSPEEK
ncbi:MAG: hypothetical protein ABWJ98_06310 [Hydrogenothermaceae bacterium]